MTNPELSSLFDLLYNNVSSNQAAGLNEAEKSVFLTKAQNMLLKEYFNPRTDGVGGGFDGSQLRQYDFSSLIRVASLHNLNTFGEHVSDAEKLDRRSKVYLFPKDYFLTVNEVISDDERQYSVLPLSYEEYLRLMLKPYNFPIKRGAWRLITSKKDCNYYTEFLESGGLVTREEALQDYNFLFDWAENRKKLEVTIAVDVFTEEAFVANQFAADFVSIDSVGKDNDHPLVIDGANFVIFKEHSNPEKQEKFKEILVNKAEWQQEKDTYVIDIRLWVTDFLDYDDKATIEMLQKGFDLLAKYSAQINKISNSKIYRAANITNGFKMCTAPSQQTSFKKTGPDPENPSENIVVGKTFVTSSVQLPLVEVIGKFASDAKYLLRYVKRPRPIILEDLTDYDDEFSIDGYKTYSECELPPETHQEIVERAVTLAKIAWQGGTVTQAATALRLRDNNE